jgi:hypothetical protein
MPDSHTSLADAVLKQRPNQALQRTMRGDRLRCEALANGAGGCRLDALYGRRSPGRTIQPPGGHFLSASTGTSGLGVG